MGSKHRCYQQRTSCPVQYSPVKQLSCSSTVATGAKIDFKRIKKQNFLAKELD